MFAAYKLALNARLHRTLFVACLVAAGISGVAKADTFNCFEGGNCTEPALTSSTSCLEDRDYGVTIQDNNNDVTVLSIHGGSIELRTSQISAALSSLYGYNRYDFNAAGTSACLDGMSNAGRLHITSTHYDDTDAVDLVSAHPRAVSIHGYNSSRNYSRGTICVGGRNAAQRTAFINFVNQNASSFAGYTLTPVDAPNSTTTCSDLGGTATANIVNRTSNTAGGLQLELGPGMRDDLVNSSASYNALRSVIYGAVNAAMTP